MKLLPSRPGAPAALVLLATALALAATGVHAAGFQQGLAADPQGEPLAVGIWYPSAAPARALRLGPVTLQVAPDGPVQGAQLPLVVMSHGTGGSFLGHADTAAALADAGFVVAAVTHTGDNHADQSRSTDIMDRPRQISRVIDHLLDRWQGRGALEPARIGMFGFSAGGFTTLASIGGVPDFSKIGPVCRQHPGDFACQLLARSGRPAAGPVAAPAPTSLPTTLPASLPATTGVADARIRAAVVAAPALGFTFAPDGLGNVRVPVQLWRAEDDALVPHPRYAEAVRLALPQSPEYHVVAGAGHFDFLAPCGQALASLAPDICTSAPGFDRAAFHERFNAQVVGFFRKALLAP